MSQNTAIGWTEATWNPVTGCSHVSPGCVNCYAEALSLRFGRSKKPWTAQNAAENVMLHPERLNAPLRWREPRMVFVNSMSDLFHELVSDGFIERVFATMALAKRHTFQILTKRPERMLSWFERTESGATRETCVWNEYGMLGRDLTWPGWPLPNVWLGVSAEDQRRADERIPVLLDTPAAMRFISFEPLLERVEFAEYARTGLLHWAITGGESGPNYRSSEVEWTANIVATCDQYGIAPFVKQDSGARPGKQGRLPDYLWKRKEYPVLRVLGGGQALSEPTGREDLTL